MLQNIPNKIAALRQELGKLGINGFFQTLADEYHNEYTPEYAKRIQWVSGFLGSVGMFVQIPNRTALFVDSRYTLQAKREAGPHGIDIEPYGFENIKDWIAKHHKGPLTIGFDPWILSHREYLDLSKIFENTSIQLHPLPKNPIDAIWHDQPAKPNNPISLYEMKYAGKSRQDKIKQIADLLQRKKVDGLFLAGLDSIAWLLNLRGTDVLYVPVFLSYLLMDQQGNIILFADIKRFAKETIQDLGPTIKIVDEALLETHLKMLGSQKKCIWISPATTPYHISKIIQDNGGKLYVDLDPCQLPKAIKNATELEAIRQGHVQDGVAMVKFLAFLEDKIGKEPHTEFSLASQLNKFRLETPLCLDLSFFPISAVGPNSTAPHYRPYEDQSLLVNLGDIYLIDSGGQYKGATTDITRVIALGGNPTPQQKKIYTLVLKGHITLARAQFPKGTSGVQLDTLARYALWQRGYNYGHGTGHGVGSYLSVHEGPQGISSKNTVPLEEGMVLSNEPGCYLEGDFGVRIENVVIVVKSTVIPSSEEMFELETVTLAPLDCNLIDRDLLDLNEIEWINTYHRRVYATLSPYLDSILAKWLKDKTQAI